MFRQRGPGAWFYSSSSANLIGFSGTWPTRAVGRRSVSCNAANLCIELSRQQSTKLSGYPDKHNTVVSSGELPSGTEREPSSVER